MLCHSPGSIHRPPLQNSRTYDRQIYLLAMDHTMRQGQSDEYRTKVIQEVWRYRPSW
jgi:hypothetical protein